jgi:hypothetical protein
MMNPLGCSHLSRYFPSFSSRPAKHRTELFLGGTLLLLFLLVPGSLSMFAQRDKGIAPELLSITVTPADASIFPDRMQQFTATGMYSDGHTHDLTRRVTWSSSALDVATISREGLARAIASGQTTIEAALGPINGSTLLNVASFILTGSMETGRYVDSATLLNNGMVLIAGGCCPIFATAELYNPASGTFTPTGSMNAPRAQHTATLLNNGMVLMAGGAGDGITASAELYDPDSGTFTPTGSLNTGRQYHTATLLSNGMVLVAGGINNQSCGGICGNGVLGSAELYDPATGTFTSTGSLNTARVGHTATLLNNGMVLMAGGCTACLPGYTNSPNAAEAELYNPATGTFTRTGSLNTPRMLHTATLLDSGMVLMAGGQDSSSGNILADGELYNPATGTFTPTGSLNTARTRHRASLMHNGMVLMAGGADYWLVDFGESLGSAEVYDPASGTFTPTSSSLNDARYWETSTLLNNGMVLVAGGVGVYQYETSAELYGPITRTPPDLESIAITPKRSTLSPGATQHFIATGTFRDGSTQQLASVTWSSSNPAVAQISNDASNHGVALAIAAGKVVIEAKAGTVQGRARLTVE